MALTMSVEWISKLISLPFSESAFLFLPIVRYNGIEDTIDPSQSFAASLKIGIPESFPTFEAVIGRMIHECTRESADEASFSL